MEEGELSVPNLIGDGSMIFLSKTSGYVTYVPSVLGNSSFIGLSCLSLALNLYCFLGTNNFYAEFCF